MMRCVLLTALTLGCSAIALATGEGVYPGWGPISRGACVGDGMREYRAVMLYEHGIATARDCERPRAVFGRTRPPDRCFVQGGWSPEAGLVGGSWDAPDTSCLLQPKRRSTGVDAGTLSSSAALEGFADIHVHQMAHLGFGGSLI